MSSGQLYYCINSMHLIEMSLKYICIILINQRHENRKKCIIYAEIHKKRKKIFKQIESDLQNTETKLGKRRLVILH